MKRKIFFTMKGFFTLIMYIPAFVIFAQTITVKGTITDVTFNEPIIGATVIVQGNPSQGTVTDVDGKYTLTNVPTNGILEFSYVGMRTQLIDVKGQSIINVALLEDTELLDEVVIVGYGVQKKSSLTGSVASISSKEIQKQVAPNVASTLQGRTPGVEVLQKGGEAGADVNILIRGAGTFGSTHPLYVIDGAMSNGGLNFLNPSDIESIEILKDGAAAAIYGSRAANGVVLITTKHGKRGKTRVEISTNYSLQTPSKYLDFLDAKEHREYTEQIVLNSTNQTQAPENTNPSNPNINTDWQDSYLTNAPLYNFNSSISGGGEHSTFNTSTGYLNQEGIMKFSGFKKYNARINGTFKKGRLTVSETLSAAHTNKEPQVRMIMGIPTVPLTDEKGRYVSAGKEYYVNESKVTNPFASYSNTIKAFYLLMLLTVLSCKTHQKIDSIVSPTNDSSELLSYFNVYRGNSHSHTIFTWTHGEHREKGINDLSSPTEFHPDWHVPPGVDWKDYNTVNLDPTGYTNKQGLPDNHFELAIANGYDFYAISDHTQEPNLQPVSKDNLAWKATIKAAGKYNRPGFVALAGFEYSRNTDKSGGSGHINVLNSSEYVNADHGQRGPAPAWPEANWSVPQFYDWVKKNTTPYNNEGYVVVGFNHPSLKQYGDWDHIDDEIAEIVSTFEIHTNYKQNRWDAYIRALDKGWRLSPIGVHDNHGYSAILNKKLPPPTLVLAPELTKEAITKALRERRTFASWNEGVELRYAVNNQIMGSTIDKSAQYKFFIEIIAPGPKVRYIQILRNHPDGEGTSIAAEQSFEGDEDKVVWETSVKDEDARYYLLQVFHENDRDSDGKYKKNGSTVSAPVWIKR